MPYRNLLRYLLSNEQVIQKLADSYPIRRAAQLTASLFHRGKALGGESWEKLQSADSMKDTKLGRFGKTFQQELKKEFDDMNKQLGQKRKPPY